MKSRTERTRLDVLVVERGLSESRKKAHAMILAGEVTVDGKRAEKAGVSVASNASIEVTSKLQRYASRGGLKLEGALEDFALSVEGKICLDVGASTGGFTDCLLHHGAKRVYAVDVNTKQLAWKLQQAPRVKSIEKNARELRQEDIGEDIDVVVLDVSFISVTKVLGPAVAAAKQDADFLILIKPQFELRREDVGRNGIVRSVALHEKAVASVRAQAVQLGLECLGTKPSRLAGAEGNQEYFLHARKNA